MSEKLKPCPFCGSDNIVKEFKGNNYSKKRFVTIKCKNCIIKRTTGAIRHTIEWCEEQAIQEWNRRVKDE